MAWKPNAESHCDTIYNRNIRFLQPCNFANQCILCFKYLLWQLCFSIMVWLSCIKTHAHTHMQLHACAFTGVQKQKLHKQICDSSTESNHVQITSRRRNMNHALNNLQCNSMHSKIFAAFGSHPLDIPTCMMEWYMAWYLLYLVLHALS